MKSIIKITILLMIIILCAHTFVFASDFNPDEYNPENPENIPLTDADKQKIADVTANILMYVRYCGIVLSVVILSIIGLKFILNSAEEKAKYMESMLPYIIGCFLLMASTIIPSMVYNAMH